MGRQHADCLGLSRFRPRQLSPCLFPAGRMDVFEPWDNPNTQGGTWLRIARRRSPEARNGRMEDVTTAGDVYSLGRTMPRISYRSNRTQCEQ
jgi:hypothetical protein